jgi:hypothetical protein
MLADLTLEPDDDGRLPPGPALVLGAQMPDRELRAAEQLYRMRGTHLAAAQMVLFTEEADDGSESWDQGQAAKWQRAMDWPRPPTIEEAQAFQLHAIARIEADLWHVLHGDRPEPG